MKTRYVRTLYGLSSLPGVVVESPYHKIAVGGNLVRFSDGTIMNVSKNNLRDINKREYIKRSK